jgi:hypothetical protein
MARCTEWPCAAPSISAAPTKAVTFPYWSGHLTQIKDDTCASQRSLDKASGETIYSYFYLIKDRLK